MRFPHEAIEWVSDRNHLWSPEIHSRERRRKYAIDRVRQHVCRTRTRAVVNTTLITERLKHTRILPQQ